MLEQELRSHCMGRHTLMVLEQLDKLHNTPWLDHMKQLGWQQKLHVVEQEKARADYLHDVDDSLALFHCRLLTPEVDFLAVVLVRAIVIITFFFSI